MASSGTYNFTLSNGEGVLAAFERARVRAPSIRIEHMQTAGGELVRRYPTVPLIIVYQATNSTNGKRYIGVTTHGLHRRVRGHKAQAKSGNKSYFSKAVKKYGIDTFYFEILAEFQDATEALRHEREMISALKPEYNTAAGGRSGPQGWKHSEESRRSMSLSHIGQVGPWKGKKRSIESIIKRTETRRNNGNYKGHWLGKKMPRAMVEKRLETIKLLPIPIQRPSPAIATKRLENMKLANERRMNPIYCVTDGKAFRNPNEAAIYYGVARSAMRRWVKGEAVCQRGLKFEYVR